MTVLHYDPPFKKASSGAALIIVLSVVVLLAVIVLSLTLAMRIERQSASVYRARTQANLLATEGVEYVAGALRAATAADRQWVSTPGRIVSSTGSLTAASPAPEVFRLFSAADGESDESINLNRKVISGDGLTAITGDLDESVAPFPVGWIYVRQNGEREVSPAINKTNDNNPIVGRFAFWTDDESTRINVNTAWKAPGNPNTLNHPSQIDLTALPDWSTEQADELHTAAQQFPFVSPEDVFRVAPGLASERFALTHRSSSVATNPWGEPKIFLTTRLDRLPPKIQALPPEERRLYYFDITAQDNADPGNFANLDAVKVERTLKHLHNMLVRSEWPHGEGSFADRYGDLNTAQIVIDLMEYVRSVESPRKFVTPLRVYFSPAGDFSVNADEIGHSNPRILIGATRRPYITELGIWDDGMGVAANGDNPARRYFILRGEFVVPKSAGFTAADLQNMLYYFTIRFQPGGSTAFQPLGSSTHGNDGTTSASNMTVSETERYWIFVIEARTSSQYVNLPPSGNVFMRLLIRGYIADDPRNDNFQPSIRDVAPAVATLDSYADAPTYWIECPVNPQGSVGRTAQVSDPRINKYSSNFQVADSTLGNLNANWLEDRHPSQDRDSGGNVTDAGFVLPSVPTGSEVPRIESIAEIGYVATGSGAQIPWRTIRLQPALAGDDGPPDWALVDLFFAPYFPTDDGQIDPTESAAGRINLNADVIPFEDSFERRESLRALLMGRAPDAEIENRIDNIQNGITTVADRLGVHRVFSSVGQLAEIAGMADSGEASEQTLRGILDLASVQGNVFRVYSVGQSLKQTPQGRLVVQAEDFVMSMLERDADGNVKTILQKAIPY